MMEERTLIYGRYLGGNPVFSILICDDDAKMVDIMRELTGEVFQKVREKIKIHTFTNGMSVSDQILSGCDIALLDVDFDNANYNGMDIARKIRTFRNDTVIIFVTNFIEYAPEGYEVNALRYVLKQRIKTELKPSLLLALKGLYKESLPIQVNGEFIRTPLDDILYIEVQQHNVTVVTQNLTSQGKCKEYSFYATLSDLEERLEPLGFLRIHKSYLVNLKHLKKFQCREAVLDNDIILRVSEKNYAENKRKFLLWKGMQ